MEESNTKQHFAKEFTLVGPAAKVFEIAQWVETASPEQIGLAIIYGRTQMEVSEKFAPRASTPAMVYVTGTAATGSALSGGVTDVPTYKGQIGEDHVEKILREKFTGVQNVAKNARSGDLSLLYEHKKTVIEVKNYSNPVPTAQVEKFQRDLFTTGASAGVFISLRTPITGIQGFFSLRYENIDGRILPCIYLVSSEDDVIVTAVNMVTQILSAFEFIDAELQSKDKILHSVYGISEDLDELARIRHSLQNEMAVLTGKLYEQTSEVFKVESDLRRIVSAIKSELFHTSSPDAAGVIKELETNAYFSKCNPDVKQCTGVVMRCIQDTLSKTSGSNVWKLSAKKCTNAGSGISLVFLSGRVQVSIPRAKMSPGGLAGLLTQFGQKISITSSDVLLDVDSSTIEQIKPLLH